MWYSCPAVTDLQPLGVMMMMYGCLCGGVGWRAVNRAPQSLSILLLFNGPTDDLYAGWTGRPRRQKTTDGWGEKFAPGHKQVKAPPTPTPHPTLHTWPFYHYHSILSGTTKHLKWSNQPIITAVQWRKIMVILHHQSSAPKMSATRRPFRDLLVIVTASVCMSFRLKTLVMCNERRGFQQIRERLFQKQMTGKKLEQYSLVWWLWSSDSCVRMLLKSMNPWSQHMPRVTSPGSHLSMGSLIPMSHGLSVWLSSSS